MRRTAAGVVSTLVLAMTLLLLAPAHAASSTTVAWPLGDNPAGVDAAGWWSSKCDAGNAAGMSPHRATDDDTLALAEHLKPAVISQAGQVSWDALPGSGARFGPAFTVSDPSTLSALSLEVRNPGQQAIIGRVGVYFHNPADGPDHYWFGEARVNDTATNPTQWHALQFANTNFTWRRYIGTTADLNTTPVGTIASFTKQFQSAPAIVGFELGCSGSATGTAFDFDSPSFTTVDDGVVSYDLEAPRTRLTMAASGSTTGIGGGISFGLTLTNEYTRQPMSVPVALEALQYGSRTWRVVGTSRAAGVKVVVRPTVHTSYRWHFLGIATDTAVGAPSYSSSATVSVRPRLSGSVKKRHLNAGAKISLGGTVAPSRSGLRVSLQRQVHGHWVTLATTRTTGSGKYHLTKRANRKGQWHLRALLYAQSGLLTATSPTHTVKVTAKPKPKRKHRPKHKTKPKTHEHTSGSSGSGAGHSTTPPPDGGH